MQGIKFEGNLKDIPFPRVLYEIYKMRATGILKVEVGKISKSIYISEGNPIWVTSNLLKDTFGRFLLRSNKISKRVYEESLKTMILTRKKHGEILMEMGYISSHAELYELLAENMKDKIIDLFGIRDGFYSFTTGEEGFPDNILRFNLSTLDILIKGIRERVDIESIKSELAPYMDRLLILREYKELEEHLKLEKDPFLLFKGEKPLKEIVEESGSDRENLYRTLYIMIVTGLLEPAEKEGLTAEDRDLKERLMGYYMGIKSKNYFEIFGVREDAPLDEIRKRYLSLAKEYHPDRYFNKPKEIRDLVGEIFTVISSAYDILADERRRKEYIGLLRSRFDKRDADHILSAELQFQKGKAFLSKKEYPNAIEAFEWACKLNPEEGEYYAYLGWATFRNSLPEYKRSIIRVKELFKKALNLNPRSDKAHYFLGLIYKTEGEFELAEKEFK